MMGQYDRQVANQFASETNVIPKSIQFERPKTTIWAEREQKVVWSENPTYASNANKRLRIHLPQVIMDMRNAFITFDAKLNHGAVNGRFANGIWSIFERLRIVSGSSEIEDLNEYNRLMNLIQKATNYEENLSALAIESMGVGTQAQRNALHGVTGVTRSYVMPLFSGVLDKGLLPLKYLPQHDVTIELYLADPTTCCECSGATVPVIELSNIQLHFEEFKFDPMYERALESTIRSTGFTFSFFNWIKYQNSLNTSLSQTVVIQHKSQSVNGMINLFVRNDQINNVTVNDKFLTWLPQNIKDTQLDIETKKFPQQPTDLARSSRFEAYQIYCRWIQCYKADLLLEKEPPLDQTNFINDSFLQIDDFEPFPELLHVINTFRLKNTAMNLQKTITFTAPPSANLQLDSWIQYYRQVNLSPNSSIVTQIA